MTWKCDPTIPVSGSCLQVYSEMRQLAELKYGLLLDDTHLPGDSSGHGFDFAETIKDVCTFARSYSYNLIKQVSWIVLPFHNQVYLIQTISDYLK